MCPYSPSSQGEDDVTDLIWKGFSCGDDDPSVLPQCTLYFVHNVMTVFDEAVKRLESNATTSTEVHGIMIDVKDKLQQRHNDKFYGSAAAKLLRSDDVSANDRHKFELEAEHFLTRCLTYLNKWYDYEHSFFKGIALLSLNDDIEWSELLSLVENLGSLGIDCDKLYEEFCILRKCQPDIVKSAANVADRWVKFFSSVQPQDVQMLRVVLYVLSIPVSNANCERVFSIMNELWSDSRNRLRIELVKAELMVKINFNMSCNHFYDFICQDKKLLKAAKSQDKYNFKAKQT